MIVYTYQHHIQIDKIDCTTRMSEQQCIPMIRQQVHSSEVSHSYMDLIGRRPDPEIFAALDRPLT